MAIQDEWAIHHKVSPIPNSHSKCFLIGPKSFCCKNNNKYRICELVKEFGELFYTYLQKESLLELLEVNNH